MLAKKLARNYGEKKLAALRNEFLHSNDANTFMPISPKHVTAMQKLKLLKAVSLFKKKLQQTQIQNLYRR